MAIPTAASASAALCPSVLRGDGQSRAAFNNPAEDRRAPSSPPWPPLTGRRSRTLHQWCSGEATTTQATCLPVFPPKPRAATPLRLPVPRLPKVPLQVQFRPPCRAASCRQRLGTTAMRSSRATTTATTKATTATATTALPIHAQQSALRHQRHTRSLTPRTPPITASTECTACECAGRMSQWTPAQAGTKIAHKITAHQHHYLLCCRTRAFTQPKG